MSKLESVLDQNVAQEREQPLPNDAHGEPSVNDVHTANSTVDAHVVNQVLKQQKDLALGDNLNTLVDNHNSDACSQEKLDANSADDKAEDSVNLEANSTLSLDADAVNEDKTKLSSDSTLDPSMDNEISRVTGRPRLTKEDNEALRTGARFFHKAMEARARALGEEYAPYRIPAHMRAALAQIDYESAVEKAKEKAAAAGVDVSKLKESDLELEHSAIEEIHAVSNAEKERLRREEDEKHKIEAGGPRFYSHYQKLISRDSSTSEESTKGKLLKNLKLALIVIVALAGYIGYNEFMGSREAQSVSELKSMLPMPIDAHTVMVRIDDRNDNFKIYFERSPEAYKDMTEWERDASLDRLAQNAPMLCNNALLHSIIVSGKKVTVLLDATDGSFHREFAVESCPVEKTPQ